MRNWDAGDRESLAAPDLLRVEAVSVIRRPLASDALTVARATTAIDDLVDLPITIYPTAVLLRRAWELRDNVTAYDACYVALAGAGLRTSPPESSPLAVSARAEPASVEHTVSSREPADGRVAHLRRRSDSPMSYTNFTLNGCFTVARDRAG